MKAILVIDEMPTDCNECPCYYEEGYRCQVHMEIDEYLDHGKPLWCPLKPMPNEIEDGDYNDFQFRFQQGFNACREMIKGETE